MYSSPSETPAAPTDAAGDSIGVVVTGRRRLTDTVTEFTFAPVADTALPDWTPGSHIDVLTPSGVTRQYSLCATESTADAAGSYRIAVDRTPDSRGGSSSMHADLAEGMQAWISAPRNHFALTRALHYTFVAGGIGITPILSLIDQVQTADRGWELIYLAKSRADMAYVEELAARFGERVRVHESTRLGRLDLATTLADLPRGAAVYACGPTTLLDAVEAACAEQDAVDAFTERFVAPDMGERENSEFEVSLAFSGQTLTVPADRTVLEALEDLGVPAPSSCREGMCGTCEAGVVSGEVDHRDVVLTPEERAENESMMVCVSRCTSGRLVLEL